MNKNLENTSKTERLIKHKGLFSHPKKGKMTRLSYNGDNTYDICNSYFSQNSQNLNDRVNSIWSNFIRWYKYEEAFCREDTSFSLDTTCVFDAKEELSSLFKDFGVKIDLVNNQLLSVSPEGSLLLNDAKLWIIYIQSVQETDHKDQVLLQIFIYAFQYEVDYKLLHTYISILISGDIIDRKLVESFLVSFPDEFVKIYNKCKSQPNITITPKVFVKPDAHLLKSEIKSNLESAITVINGQNLCFDKEEYKDGDVYSLTQYTELEEAQGNNGPVPPIDVDFCIPLRIPWTEHEDNYIDNSNDIDNDTKEQSVLNKCFLQSRSLTTIKEEASIIASTYRKSENFSSLKSSENFKNKLDFIFPFRTKEVSLFTDDKIDKIFSSEENICNLNLTFEPLLDEGMK